MMWQQNKKCFIISILLILIMMFNISNSTEKTLRDIQDNILLSAKPICSPGCSTCTSFTQCTKCAIASCCDPNCNNCTAANAESGNVTCQSCNQGFTLSKQANACHADQCTNNSTTCLECKDAKTCSKCPSEEFVYNETNICTSCGVANCEVCLGYGQCVICALGYYVTPFNPDSGQPNNCNLCILPHCTACASATICLACQSNGYYINITSHTCQACQLPCNGCTMHACTNCIDGYYINKISCLQCSQKCATCGGSATSCTSCNNDLILVGNICADCQTAFPLCTLCNRTVIPVKCIACQSGFYPNNINHQCQACNVVCQTCQNGNGCITCHPTYTLNVSNGQCLSCLDGCLSCRLITDNSDFNSSCTSCSVGSILVSAPTNSSISICQLCDTYSISNCAKCLPDRTCYACYQSYNLVGQNCVSIYDNGTPGWAIFLIIIAVLIFILLIGFAAYYLLLMKKKRYSNTSLLEGSVGEYKQLNRA